MAFCAWAPTRSGRRCLPSLSYWRELGARYVTALVRLARHRRAKQAASADRGGRRVGHDGRGRSAHDRRGIPDGGCPGRSVARHGSGLRCRVGSVQALRAGVPQEPSSGLESGRARPFQPCREPEGRGRPVRVSGDLHDTAFRRGQGAASAARQGLAGVCRRKEPRAPALAADAGPARRRALPLAEGHGRRRRDLSPAALEPAAGAAIPEGRSRARKRRRGRADAGELAHEPPRPPAGEGNGRRQGAVAVGAGRAARLPDGGDARRRKLSRGRDQAAAGAIRRAGL